MIIIVAADTVSGVPGVPAAPAQVAEPPAPTAQATASTLPNILLSLPDNAATIIQSIPGAIQRVIGANKDVWTELGNNAGFMAALPGALIKDGNTTAVLARDTTFINKMCTDQEFLATANRDPMVQDRMRQAQSEAMANNPPHP